MGGGRDVRRGRVAPSQALSQALSESRLVNARSGWTIRGGSRLVREQTVAEMSPGGGRVGQCGAWCGIKLSPAKQRAGEWVHHAGRTAPIAWRRSPGRASSPQERSGPPSHVARHTTPRL